MIDYSQYPLNVQWALRIFLWFHRKLSYPSAFYAFWYAKKFIDAYKEEYEKYKILIIVLTPIFFIYNKISRYFMMFLNRALDFIFFIPEEYQNIKID